MEHIFSCPIWHKEWGGYSFSAIQKLIFNGHVLQIVKIPELNGGRDASEWFCSAIARKINRDIESELLNI